ncbi:MAG: HAD family hydrolase [Chloroflexota bacterium]|nr:HAD family hydrolase [Chloroflexota bacterium]
MAIRAVVFDAFDTLFPNTRDLWRDCFVRICHDQGLSVDPGALYEAWAAHEYDFRRRRVDVETLTQQEPFETYFEVWRDTFVEAFDALGVDGDADGAAGYFLEDLGTRPAFPETVSVLERLRDLAPIAVLSNADDAFLLPVLERHGLSDAFAAVVSSEGARLYKPATRIFELMLERLGTAAAETLMVGDTLLDDIYGAHMAGMPGAWINRYGAPMDGRVAPAYEVRSLEELLPIVAGEPVGG